AGPVPLAVWPAAPGPAPVRVIDTETRTRTRREAARRVRGAAAAARATRYFKKIDSTLRGRIGVEVDALLAAVGAPGALVCPAFPAHGRVVMDRVLLVDGAPVAETAVGRDPEFPRPPERRPGAASSVVELLRGEIDRPLAWIPLDHVRAPVEQLTARLRRLSGTVGVADAETDADLDALVDAALGLEPAPLLVGSAGLARALAEHLGFLADPVSVPAGRWLIIAGSRHPATRRQVAAARDAGMTVLATPEVDEGSRSRAAAHLAQEAKRALEAERFQLVVVTGGETAIALYEALGAERIDLVGAPAPGLAFGYLRGRDHAALPLLTKAGGFGAPDLLVSLAREVPA
ncbi:MAG: four-carbon acid sugar kinase family protein, partial [Candidatus Rokuibacteriota bacterium]